MEERSKKLYEELADKLIVRIQKGEFQAGDRLPAERVLAKEYGVNRSVVREAIRSMERVGCVVSRTGGGTYVKTPEVADIADPLSMILMQDEQYAVELFETRMLLETEIARLAAVRRTPEQVLEMKQTLARMREEIQKGGLGEKQDRKFHSQLVKAAGNRALELVISTCSEALNQSIEITQHIEGVPVQALEDHERILEAVIAGNVQEAEQSMRRHLMSAQENLQKVQKSKKHES